MADLTVGRFVIILRSVTLKSEFTDSSRVLTGRIRFQRRICDVEFFTQFCVSTRIPMITRLLLFLFAVALIAPASHCVAQPISSAMIKVPYKGKDYVGQPLVWDGTDVVLKRRDGRISRLPATDLNSMEVVEDKYIPYQSDEMVSKLRVEFGSKYQVSPTKNFIVVHPPGSSQKWAQPFQDLYYRFRIFFKGRGVELEEPQAPLVAIVLRTRKEYDRFIKDYQPGLGYSAGYYSPRSNRIITYDRSDQGDWLNSNDTIVHEATHQTAYNTGIHARFANAPRWLTEGLAQLFEAKGINNSRYYGQLSDRINKGALRELMELYRKEEVAGVMEQLVQSDSLFRTDVNRSYAISWGMSLFLSESYPKKYVAYLAHDGGREPFRGNTRSQRAKDFAKFFGTNFTNLEARMKSFFEDLKE